MELFDTVITTDARNNVLECLASGHLSEGKLVRKFEERIEEEFGYTNCVAVNSGTSALQLVLHEILREGEEVILPAQTFVATGIAVLLCGGKPVFADIDPLIGCISVEDVKKKITSKTKAVISVSWAGNPPELDRLESLCKEKDIYFIQDNAQALGATYKGFPVSAWGDYSCFSFQATKHLTTGDGGMVACSDPVDYSILKNLRWFGINREHDLPDHTGERQYTLYDIGMKVHMNDYSASLGLGNLQNIHRRIQKRRNIASLYDNQIKWNMKNLFKVSRNEGSSCWVYDLLVNRREDFLEKMKEKGVPASVVHVGIHNHPVFEWNGELKNQDFWDKHHVSLPCHSSMTLDDMRQVVDAVNGDW